MHKKWLALLLCAVLAGCQAAPAAAPKEEEKTTDQAEANAEASSEEQSSEDQKFSDYLDQYVIQTCSMDYTTAHSYFMDPEEHGIKFGDDAYSLGDFIPTKKEKDFTASVLKDLEGFDSSKLNRTNQVIYEQMKWENELQEKGYDDRFTYLDNIWSESHGVVSNLINYFSEFQLYSEKDVDALLKLIANVPDYAEKALEYSRTQAEKGMLGIDLDQVFKSCDEILDNQENSPVYTELAEEVDMLMLDEETADGYKKQIRDALDESFFPSFSKIEKGLELLEGQVTPIQGLASYPNGDEYYKLILENYTSTDTDPDELYEEISAAVNDQSEKLSKLMKKGIDPSNVQTGFKSIDDIMSFLEENYSKAFPVVDTMDYEIKALTDEQSTSGVVAYFVVPTIDSNRTYQIRYNKRDYGKDPGDLEFYNTLAHEGIPGHMYQTQYEKQHFTSDAQYLLSSMAMQEGYATYAAEVAQSWLNVNPDQLEASQADEWSMNYMILILDLMINYDGLTADEFVQQFGTEMLGLYNQLAEDPGIFFAYYYGYYLITQKRDEAEKTLGKKFDETGFNSALLQYGNVKFSLIDENIDRWINSVK